MLDKRDGGIAAVYVHLDSLTPWADMPRPAGHEVDEIAKSIQAFGFGRPMVARSENREIIAGHKQRLAVIKLRGVYPGAPAPWMVPCRFRDLTEVEAHTLALADNRTGELAAWDDEALDAELRKLLLDDTPPMVIPGFDPEDLERLLEQAGGPPPPKPPRPPRHPETVALVEAVTWFQGLTIEARAGSAGKVQLVWTVPMVGADGGPIQGTVEIVASKAAKLDAFGAVLEQVQARIARAKAVDA